MIKYKVTKRKNPKTREERFHPAIVTPNPINPQKLIDRITARCTVTSSDVKAVLDALEFEMVQAFTEGNAVRLGDVGSFRPSLRTKGVKEEKDCNASLVKRVGIVYTPSLRLKRDLDVKSGGVKFEKTEVLLVKPKAKPSAPAEGGHEG